MKCKIHGSPTTFTQGYLSDQKELKHKLGHFSYLLCLKTPFLALLETKKQMGKNGGTKREALLKKHQIT